MVFGAGALGSLVAARLSTAHSVTLVGRREHVLAIRATGLRVTGRTKCVATTIDAVDDIRARIWLKAILNAAVNPLTALLAKRTGELIGDPALESAIRLIVHESVAIAHAAGIALEEDGILEKIWSVVRATKDNKSSMLQDLERGRRTEIDAINGALLDRARALGVAAPQNELLFHLIRAAERNKTP